MADAIREHRSERASLPHDRDAARPPGSRVVALAGYPSLFLAGAAAGLLGAAAAFRVKGVR